MTTAVIETRVTATRPGWARLLGPLGGLGLVAGLVAVFVSPASDDTGSTATEVVAYATSHEGWSIAILLFAVASVGLSGLFVAGLHARLRPVATDLQSALILLGGAAFALSFAFCWLIWMAPLIDMPDETASALAQAEAYLALDDIGWCALAMAGVAASLMIVAASLAAIRAGLPRWLGWLGVLAGLLSLGTLAFFGMFAWMAWIAAASIVMLVARPA